MKGLKIRPLKRKDKSSIVPLLMDSDLRRTFAQFYSSNSGDANAKIEMFIKDKSIKAFSIVLNEEVIGIIKADYYEKTKEIRIVFALAKNQRNKGIMTAALKRTFEELKKQKKHSETTIRMFIPQSNKAAMKVAEKLCAELDGIYYKIYL